MGERYRENGGIRPVNKKIFHKNRRGELHHPPVPARVNYQIGLLNEK